MAASQGSEVLKQHLRLDVDMWRIGDLYDVPTLKGYAAAQLFERLKRDHAHNGASQRLSSIILPVYEYSTRENRELRVIVMKFLRKHRSNISADEEATSSLQDIQAANQDFVANILADYLAPACDECGDRMVPYENCEDCGAQAIKKPTMVRKVANM